ncbi:MAG: 6-bladed beta-propeller [bacterium]
MPSFRTSVATCLAILAITGGVASAALPAGDELPSHRRIDNGPEPEHGVLDVPLHELWRAGGEDQDVFFGNVLQVLPGPDDTIYVLDVQLVQVFVFSQDGEFLRTLGSTGEGPGEVNNVNSMLVWPDGTLGLGQVLPGKLALIDRGGDPVQGIKLVDPDAPDSGFVLLMNGFAGEGFMALAGMRWGMSDAGELSQHMFLRRHDREGKPAATFLRKTSALDATWFVFDELAFDFVWTRFAITSAGEVCFAPERNEYALHFCHPDGRLDRIVRREYRSLQRNAEDLRQAELTCEAIGSQYGRELKGVTVEKTEPDITGLWSAPDGAVWVRTSRGDRERDPGVLTTVDVLDPEGRFIEQRRLKCPGDPRHDAIHFLPGNRVVVVTGAVDAYRRDTHSTTAEGTGADERPLEVICYGRE